MSAFIAWYLLLTLLGGLTVPLAYRLFPALPDRGYTLARTAGLLIWGYIFWLLTSLGVSYNDRGGMLLALALLAGLSFWSIINHRSKIGGWLATNLRLIVATELLFLSAFALLAIIRAANPEILGTEKPMELAFINSILRSPTFPPRDPWLSGYAISYYHFGYIMTAMIAKFTAVPGTLAFNLMIALVFALAAVGAYGILYNLLAIDGQRSARSHAGLPLGLPLLGPLFLLIVSNIEALFEILHRLGIFWSTPASSKFWLWLDIQDLTSQPSQPLGWMPDRYLWWWRASRVVQDYDLVHNPQEIIDEFPFFSFLLGDLHPHVLAIPFALLAISVALHAYLGASRDSFTLLGTRLHLSPVGFVFAALVLGGLAFLNTWDILVAAALMVSGYLLFRAREDGWNWNRLEDLLHFGLPLGLLAVLFYLPFYISFSSQAGGILPNLINPTRGAHLWMMFASLFIPIIVYLYWPGDKPRVNWKQSFGMVSGFALLLWIGSWLMALLVRFADPAFTASYLQSQGTATLGEFFAAASLRRLAYLGGLLTLMALLIPSAAYLISSARSEAQLQLTAGHGTHPPPAQPARCLSARHFIFLLVTLGGILVLTPDFLYLRDQFGWRINTIFKFYYQAWILWSLAAAFAMATMLRSLRGTAGLVYRILMGITLALALIYPVLGLWTKTNQFQPPYGYTLDDFHRVWREAPDEAAALQWLQTAPEGVVAESVGGSYTNFARISTYSGLSTVLGWPGHESQWRGGHAPQGTRNDDIITLYATSDWETARSIIEKYDIRYIYLGSLERTSMRVQEDKFRSHLQVVFQQGNVVIYEVP